MATEDSSTEHEPGGRSSPSSPLADAVDAVRAAVERTLHATAGGAAGTQKRTRDLVDEIASTASRVREAIDHLRVLEDLRGLRSDVADLARRVEALEQRQADTAAAPKRAGSRTRRSAAGAAKDEPGSGGGGAGTPRRTSTAPKASGGRS